MDLQAVRATASEIARAAGAVLMEKFEQPHQERTKKNDTDIVTEADLASEAVVLPRLTKAFPDHHIVSEEGGGAGIGKSAEEAEYFWYVDPLDGTTNYASNIPFFSVSLGLADKNMNPLVGVVYDPFSDELYSAALGHGATRNDKPIHVSPQTALRQAVLCSGFPYESINSPDSNIAEWKAFTIKSRGLRRFGSIALELSYVASNRLEGLWERSVNAWDVMAGIVLVREAGGTVTDYSNQESKIVHDGKQVLASNGHIHQQMIEVLRSSSSFTDS
ncbi:MAG: inositol monophosphatase [Anaerolineae bacterium]|nr:inositol monophosphatase [Anaerolineae bacterium]